MARQFNGNIFQKTIRLFNSLTTQLLIATIAISLVGLAFAIKSYLHVQNVFGNEASIIFLSDLLMQMGIIIAMNLIAVWVIYRIVTLRILTLCEVMRDLTENKYDTEVPYTQMKSEFGSMARKVQIFKENGLLIKQLEQERIESAQKRETERKALLNKIADDFNNKVKNIVEIVNSSSKQMEKNSRQVASSFEASYKSINHLSSEANKASNNVNMVAGAAEELSLSIHEISQQVTRSSNITKDAVRKAETISKIVTNLSGSAEKIGSVTGIINDIAEQINLLALNATIEAARAGDAGKGFAVVASEVKNLANQTAKATDEISAIITSMQDETKTSVTSIIDVSHIIGEINNVATTIATAIEEQNASTQEIARNIQDAATHTNTVSSNITSISDISKSNSSSATEMLKSCMEVITHSNVLDIETDSFIATLRDY